MQKTPVDIAIVGGGLGGLYAAHELLGHGLEVCLLEAKDRVGGRILGLPSAAAELQVDLGPTWFWPHQPRIQRLLLELGIERYDQYTAGEAIYELSSGELQRGGSSLGMEAWRVHGGMQRIVQKLGKRLAPGTLRLSHSVDSIERSSDRWVLRCAGIFNPVLARYLILALPPRIIVRDFAGAPWLSAKLYRALQDTPTWMAAQAKFVATFDTGFWRNKGLAGDAFSQLGPMVEIHDASAATDDGFALFGFLGVPAEVRTGLSVEVLKNHCLAQFERLFGPEVREVRQKYLIDWAQDPQISTEADLNQASAHPQMDLTPFKSEFESINLGFAVTEAATEDPGYIEGALQSAKRAVGGCLDALFPSGVSADRQ